MLTTKSNNGGITKCSQCISFRPKSWVGRCSGFMDWSPRSPDFCLHLFYRDFLKEKAYSHNIAADDAVDRRGTVVDT